MKTQYKTDNSVAITTRRARRSPCLALACLLITGLLSFGAIADTPMPEIPKGKGDKCMDDTDVMRKSHMDKLLHKRDETMYQGIRTKQFSLKQCISCHAVNGDDNKPVNATSPKHFCRVCHDYASVRIDCFECHASKPRPKKLSLKMPSLKKMTNIMNKSLRNVTNNAATKNATTDANQSGGSQ